MRHSSFKWLEMLRCPACKGKMDHVNNERFTCKTTDCQQEYPVIGNVPILIDGTTSIFSINDYLSQQTITPAKVGKLQRIANKIIPDEGLNLKANSNYKSMISILQERSEKPKVLIVGAGDVGEGLEEIVANNEIDFFESDVAINSRTDVVCDAHELPFASDYFDGVIIQAVLEHVLDPSRCVQEIHRVLKTDGIVYAETPFMQGVHAGRHDFTRFTDLGHRRLFRNFEEIERGACCGTGMALAASYQAFLKSLVKSRNARNFMIIFGRLTSFWLKYFDRFSINSPASLDAASGLFFLGRKSHQTLSDRELVSQFKGASGSH